MRYSGTESPILSERGSERGSERSSETLVISSGTNSIGSGTKSKSSGTTYSGRYPFANSGAYPFTRKYVQNATLFGADVTGACQ